MSRDGVDPVIPQAAAGSGAAFGGKVLRLASIHTVGLFLNQALTLIGAVVVALFLGPSEFGRYGLLLFAAGLLSFLFNLGSKQGTLKRVFGGGDDDDDGDDDDEEEELVESRQRALGTGLVLTAGVSLLGTALVVIFAGPVSSFLLGEETDRELIVWAGLAGGFGSLLRLGSLVIWMEHRPVPYVALETLRPLLALVIVVPLLATGAGIVAAIASYAIGSAIAAAAAAVLLGRSVEFCFEPAEAITIMRRGAQRVPIVTSMWTVGYMDLFLLSRFVSETDLGIYHLASKAGFAVAFLPAGYRKALRPLRKTPGFAAIEDEYGVGVARGQQLGYFLLILIGVLLAVTLAARVLGELSPDDYGDAAALVPLLSAGLVAPTVYRMLSKSTKFKGKPVYFIGGAVVAAVLFIGISLLLIPELGIWAPPIAMLIAFAIPGTAIVAKGQRGRSPMRPPTRSFLTASSTAAAIAGAYYLAAPEGLALQIIGAVAAMVLWLALLPLSGAIPRYHLRPLAELVKGAVGKGGPRFDFSAVAAELSGGERKALRQVIRRHRPLHRVAAKLDLDEAAAAEQLVHSLRRFAADGEMESAEWTDHDAEIGRYLFARATPADRAALGKELMKSKDVKANDLRELELIIEELRRVPGEAWPTPNRSRSRSERARA